MADGARAHGARAPICGVRPRGSWGNVFDDVRASFNDCFVSKVVSSRASWETFGVRDAGGRPHHGPPACLVMVVGLWTGAVDIDARGGHTTEWGVSRREATGRINVVCWHQRCDSLYLS